MPPHPALWLLADSRLPTGGHAHSAGLESGVRRGQVRSADDVETWLDARVPTTGAVTAGAAAAACALVGRAADRASGVEWEPWDAAVSARTPVAALRQVSRQQGRAMARTVRVAWPHAALDGLGGRPHQALVLGVATAAAGGDPHEAAALAVHHLVGQVCSAAVRLLGLDPLALAGVHARALAEHAPVVGTSAAAGIAAVAADDPTRLPTATTPLPEVLAVLHARSEGALFAS